MNYKKLKLKVLGALIFLIFSSNIFGAQDKIMFAPEGVVASIGDTFEINIAIDSGVVDLFAYSIHLKYDSSVIKIIDSYPTSEFSTLSHLSPYFIGADSVEINPITGDPNWYYHVFDILFTNPKTTVDGYFELSTVKFVAQKTGISQLYFEFYKATDTLLNSVVSSSGEGVVYICPLSTIAGDVNASGEINISDIVMLIGYMFQSGPPPVPNVLAGDVNCDVKINVSDLVYLVSYMFQQGNPPCNPCL